MSVSVTTYTSFKALFVAGLNLSSQEYGVALCLGYTPDASVDSNLAQLSAYEVESVGTNYLRADLTNVAVTRDNVNARISMSADDVTWPYAVFAADSAVIYIKGDTDLNSPLVACFSFGEVKSSDNTDFIINWSPEEGLLKIT